MTTVTIPQSVRDYMHRRAIQTAVDHLLASGAETLPEALDDWVEVRAYHRAHLSACQVRGEHALLLMDLWDAIWGEALKDTSGQWKPLSPSRQALDTEEPPTSPNDLWDKGYPFLRVLQKRGAELYLYLGLNYWVNEGVQLYLSYSDEDEDELVSDNAELSDDWGSDPDDNGNRVTVDGRFIPEDQESFDVSVLRQVAASALRALKA